MSTRRKCGALCQEENRPEAGVNSMYRGVGDRKDRNVGNKVCETKESEKQSELVCATGGKGHE